uniref:Uncharacterized protein n=1 Tax=Timema cristinae TaxID=61476 RepID=A0A7R9DCA9_TIMCR|nr:unnamed protein product [Timema cristinae]
MAKKSDAMRGINVSVVGLSGIEKDKGQLGVGKSCLCNRFMRSLADEYSVDHISVLSQTDFSGRVVNNDHFLYWGEVVKASEEGIELLFQVIEQTEFIDDASFQPFKGVRCQTSVLAAGVQSSVTAQKPYHYTLATYKSSRKLLSNPARGVIDGELVSLFLGLPYLEKVEVAKKIGTKVDEITDDLADIERLTSHF